MPSHRRRTATLSTPQEVATPRPALDQRVRDVGHRSMSWGESLVVTRLALDQRMHGPKPPVGAAIPRCRAVAPFKSTTSIDWSNSSIGSCRTVAGAPTKNSLMRCVPTWVTTAASGRSRMPWLRQSGGPDTNAGGAELCRGGERLLRATCRG